MRTARPFVVRTPENVLFRYEVAGPVERLAAYLVDLCCLIGLLYLSLILLSRLGPYAVPLEIVAVFLVQWGYFLFFEWRWNGATPGKRMLGIRVIQMGGVRCTFERLLLRNFLRVVDFLPFLYGIGACCMLFSRTGRRVGDLAAGTVCVRVPHRPPPAAIAAIRPRFNSLREDGPTRARIRQLLSPREAELVIGLALRRDLLGRETRIDLFRRTATYLRLRARLAGHERLPDESLVLNVASVLLEERVI